jgi:hypothetical protein
MDTGDRGRESSVDEHQKIVLMQIEAMQIRVQVAYREGRELAELINRGAGGREVALAITKLQEAKAWLHEALIEAN